MELRDQVAAGLLTELREARYLSPEALSHAMFLAGHGYVAGRTIRNIESGHVVPTLRIRGTIEGFFGVTVWRNVPSIRPLASGRVRA